MVWLDPRECLAARDALEQGRPAEAAQLLLASRHPQHRMVRQLLGEAGRRLVETAQQRFAAGELEAALAALHLAAQCVVLEGDAQALKRRVAEALEHQRRQEAWAAEQLDRARRLAEEGRLPTALDVLASVSAHPQAPLLRQTVEQQLGRFRRHVEACRQCLQANQAEAAYRHWREARTISPHDPQLAELANMIARVLPGDGGGSGPSRPVNDRTQRVVWNDLALVVSTGEVVLGTPRATGVHVPLYGLLHGRHAVLVRDRHGWQLIPCRDHQGAACPVWVGGQTVDGACRLLDGCPIQLGRRECAWQFRLPVAGSATAVLELAPGSRPCVCAGRKLLRRVVLLEEELRVCPAPPAHLVVPELPCRQFVIRWRRGRLGWEVEGGSVRVDLPGRTRHQPETQLFLPSRLVLEPRLEEAELLGREAAGCRPAPQLVLEFTDPAA